MDGITTVDWSKIDWEWIWIGVALVSRIALGRILARSRTSADPYLRLGEVSESWLAQRRVDKSEHRPASGLSLESESASVPRTGQRGTSHAGIHGQQ